MKIFSLLRAVLTEDMNVFKIKAKQNASKLNKILLPFVLAIIIISYMAFYAYSFAKELAPFKLTFIMLTIFLIAVVFLNFMETIYKSQGMLFDAKDNDLLFSLPIKKSTILFVRMFKLIAFQYIFNFLFIVPAFGVYVYFEHPRFIFYLMSFIMYLMLPLIPITIGSILGYFIKLIASKFKFKKIIQTILSFIIFFGIYYVCMNIESFFSDIVGKATSINDMIVRLYYPIGTYISLINKFDFITFIKFMLVNIIPFGIFIIIGQMFYFKIISNSKNAAVSKKNNKNKKIKVSKPIVSLTKKELKRYLSSSVYMFNTSFGLILLVVMTFILCFKGKEAINNILSMYDLQNTLSINLTYYFIVLFSLLMTSITSSSISLEGKTINITKSLPISFKTIFNSKILYCYVIEMPFVLISIIIFTIFLKPSILFILFIFLMAIIIIGLTSIIGLIVNLKYPKLSFTNDTEVVKQSMSAMISVFIGMGLLFTSIVLIIYLSDYMSTNLLLFLHLFIFLIISIILYVILIKKGPREYQKLSV